MVTRVKKEEFLHRRLGTGSHEASNPASPIRIQGHWHDTGVTGSARAEQAKEKQMDGSFSAADIFPGRAEETEVT